jgi:hypothetical protein
MRDCLGDLLFAANPGYLVYPNHYDREIPRGMHGYNITPASESPLNGILLNVNVPGLSLPPGLAMPDAYTVLKQAIVNL